MRTSRDGGPPLSQASSGYRWNILLLLASSQVIAYIDRVNFAVVGPQLISIHHYTPGQVGCLLSVFNWAYTLSLFVARPLTDRLRPARAFPAGVGSWSLATALCGVTQSFAPLAFLRACVGVGESLMIPSGFSPPQAWHAPCSSDGVSQHKETPMAAYLMAVFAASLAAASALTLIYTVNHFDPPQSRS